MDVPLIPSREWYGFTRLTGRFDPGLFGFFQLLQGLFWSFTERHGGHPILFLSREKVRKK
jgi:hypothetical protein